MSNGDQRLAAFYRELALVFEEESEITKDSEVSVEDKLRTLAEKRRARYINILLVFADLVIPENGAWAEEIAELASALGDLDDGRVHDFLTPKDFLGRAPEQSNVWRLRARVCLALQAFVECGTPREDAAEHIEESYPSLKPLLDKKSRRLRQAIMAWDYAFRNGQVKSQEAMRSYTAGANSLKQFRLEHTDEEVRRKAEALLHQAATEAIRINPRF